jgi:hypothetical protein
MSDDDLRTDQPSAPDAPAPSAARLAHTRRWVYILYLFLVLLCARKPDEFILNDGRVPGSKVPGRIDVTTVARRLFDSESPALAPDAYRPLASLLIVATAHLPGVRDLLTSYTIWRFLTLCLAVYFLDLFARRFLSDAGAFAVVCLYLVGFSYAGFNDKPDGWFEQALFAAGFAVLATGRPQWLVPLIAGGAWARESVVFLIAAYFLAYARRDNWTRAFVNACWLLALWCLSWGAVHYLVGHVFYYSEVWRLPRNLRGFLNYLESPWRINMAQYLVIGIFGALWAIPYLRRPRGPEFLERLKWLLPIAFAMTLQLAKIWEVRVFYYHAMYLAPLALWKLFPDLRRPSGA